MVTTELLNAYAEAITSNYYAEFPETPNGTQRDFVISFELGMKYTRVVKSTSGQRSAHSFIENSNGDIWKAASWKTPAKNRPRGNISKLTPNVVRWTSAS